MRKKVVALLLAASLLASSLVLAGYRFEQVTGVYEGVAMGYGGLITVMVTFDGGEIVDIEVDAPYETPMFLMMAEMFTVQAVLDAQSTDVDVIAGATVTSRGILTAVESAIIRATGADAAAVADGTFTARAPGFGLRGMMTADITFDGGRLVDVTITESFEDQRFADMAFGLYVDRIIESQSLAVDAVTGATTTAGGVRAMIEDAIVQAGGRVADWHTPLERSTRHVVLEGFDVVVVGLGGSGLISFAAAAEAGASVFGIEAKGMIGGHSVITSGPMVINSQHLMDRYHDGEEYIDAEHVIEVWLDYVGDDGKHDVITMFVNESGPAIDWAIDVLEFNFANMLGSFAMPVWSSIWTTFGGMISYPGRGDIFDRAFEIALSFNEDSDYRLELTARDLIFDDAGNVIGVHAVSWDGTTYDVFGTTVILATGGFIGNADMMYEFLDGPAMTRASTVSRGDGILMGQSAGGALFNISAPPMLHMIQVPHIIRTDELTKDQKSILTALALVRGGPPIVINTGEIWDFAVNRTLNPMAHTALAPNYRFYAIYTPEDFDNIRTNGLPEFYATANPNALVAQGGSFEVGVPVTDLDLIIEVGMAHGNVHRGETLAELAAIIGAPLDVLAESIGGDNGGPYYAVIGAGHAYGTTGGLEIDINMNVMRQDGTVIANLFAVGQDSLGVTQSATRPYTPWGGPAASWNFVSGRIAGANAAAYAAGN